MKALIAHMLVFLLLITTSGPNMAFPEYSGLQSSDHHPEMDMTNDMEDCHGNRASANSADAYCMDHCAHLLALAFYSRIFITENPVSVIMDPVLRAPIAEPSQLWRPPTLSS